MSPARGSSRPKAEAAPATVTAPEQVDEPDTRSALDLALEQVNEAEGYPLNLAAKTAAVMAEIHRVRKTGKNTQQGYDFAREGDIADMVRELLARYRIGFRGTLLEAKRSDIESRAGNAGTECLVRMQFVLTNGDDPTDVEETYWEGDATDYTDKALPKAITACKKSWLVFRFLVSTGDPEPDESGDEYRRAGAQRGSSEATTTAQRQAEQRGPDLRPSTPAQRQRLFGLGRTVPFLVDAASERVSQEALHNLVAWATRKDPTGPVTSLTDLNRTQIDRVFRVMERCAADVGTAAATDRAMSHWIATGEDLARSAAEQAPQPADDESDVQSSPPPASDPQFDASRLAEEARAADAATEAGDPDPDVQPEPMEGEEPLPFDAEPSPPIPEGGMDELDYGSGEDGDDDGD